MKNSYLFSVFAVFISVICIAIFGGHKARVHSWHRHKQREINPEIIDIQRNIGQLKVERLNLEKRLSKTERMSLEHMKMRIRLFAIPEKIKELEKKIQDLRYKA